MAYQKEVLDAQQRAILAAWNMPRESIDACSRAMSYADLRGIDTHGIAMLPVYAGWLNEGRLDLTAVPRVVVDVGGLALIDGGHGLGHPAAEQAMHMAIAKARVHGISAVFVRSSNHFGAAGYYASLAAGEGMAGMAFSGTPGRTVVPPLAREPAFGAVPFAFAAPDPAGQGILLDIAMSTVAMGKIVMAQRAAQTLPEGWAVDLDGNPLTDANEAARIRRLTPVGGHKGYGLGAMVESLASIASGAFVGGQDLATGNKGQYLEIGHCLLAIDIGQVAAPEEYQTRSGLFASMLRNLAPSDPARPVMAPGDPERLAMEERSRTGIPLHPKLAQEINEIARAAGVQALL
ncbi:MAG: Ldh family oxidoreductase [Rhizobiaceae bacterium]